MNFKDFWHQLSDDEKIEKLYTIILIMACVVSVLIGMNLTKTNDNEYFKSRLLILENRIIELEKTKYDLVQKTVDGENKIKQIEDVVNDTLKYAKQIEERMKTQSKK